METAVLCIPWPRRGLIVVSLLAGRADQGMRNMSAHHCTLHLKRKWVGFTDWAGTLFNMRLWERRFYELILTFSHFKLLTRHYWDLNCLYICIYFTFHVRIWVRLDFSKLSKVLRQSCQYKLIIQEFYWSAEGITLNYSWWKSPRRRESWPSAEPPSTIMLNLSEIENFNSNPTFFCKLEM